MAADVSERKNNPLLRAVVCCAMAFLSVWVRTWLLTQSFGR
jgi:hypothetical protein